MKNAARVFLSLVLGLFAVSAAWAQRPPESGPLTVELDETGIVVSGAAPDARLLLFVVAQEIEHYITTLTRRELVLTSEGDGTLTFEPDRPIAPLSVWAVIELATGRTAVAVPESFELRELTVSPTAVSPTGDTLELELLQAEIVLVRPAAGVWTTTVGDGGRGDLDQMPDGSLRAGLESLRALDGSPPPPDALGVGDVLLLLDPLDLRFAVLRPEGRGGRS